MADPSRYYDVVIVGGGIMGTSTAYYLSKRTDLDVLLLEKDTIGGGSTGQSAGVIRFHYGDNGTYAEMMKRSFPTWQEFADEIGFKQVGVLYLGNDDEDYGERRGVEIARDLGLDVDIVDEERIRELVPYVNTDDVDYAVFDRDAGIADPYAANMAFYERAREEGVEVETGVEVEGFELDEAGRKVTGVETSEGVYDCEHVVSAAGPWSTKLLATVDVSLPITPTREQVLILQPQDEFFEEYPYPFPHVSSKKPGHVYFRPEPPENILLSGHHKGEECDPDRVSSGVDGEFVQWAIDKLQHRAPALTKSEMVRGYSGVYSNTPDKDFIVDEPVDGLVCLAGFSGHGFKHAPVIGRVAADLVERGETDVVDLEQFSLDRFSGEDYETRASM